MFEYIHIYLYWICMVKPIPHNSVWVSRGLQIAQWPIRECFLMHGCHCCPRLYNYPLAAQWWNHLRIHLSENISTMKQFMSLHVSICMYVHILCMYYKRKKQPVPPLHSCRVLCHLHAVWHCADHSTWHSADPAFPACVVVSPENPILMVSILALDVWRREMTCGPQVRL